MLIVKWATATIGDSCASRIVLVVVDVVNREGHKRQYHERMADVMNLRGLNEQLAANLTALSRLGVRLSGRFAARLRKPLLIVIGGVVLLMLLVVILQSGLGVDNDVTITDSHRPEIVGGGE